jgi:predicted transposase YdaD
LANDYDKILKENIAALFLPLSGKYLHITITRSKELKDKLQTTIEKEPDFIRIVETDTNERFILHLEFQTQDEEGMIYRMQEYYGILRKKYALPVRQCVIYLGQKASRMQTRLASDEIFEGFTLQSLRDYAYQNLLSSKIPEEIILAILADFNDQKPADIIKEILFKLKEISGEEITLRKYIKQLSVLARLRNLTKDTLKQIKEMGLTYDITNDYLYKEGITKGIQQGIEKGIEQGKKEIIIQMLQDKTLSKEKIAQFARVSVEYVRSVAKEFKKG